MKKENNMIHCLDCGEKLEEVNVEFNLIKYYCKTCDIYWHKTTRTIVEWIKKDY